MKRTGWRVIPFTLVAALVIAACGGDDESPEATPPAEDEATEPAEDEAEDEGEEEEEEPAEPDEVFTLSYSTHLDGTDLHTEAVRWWAEQVNERTGGSVEVEIFTSSSLCDFVEHVECLSDGRVDLAHVAALNHPAELPISSIGTLPFVSRNIEAYARSLNDLYQDDETFRAEYENAGIAPLHFTTVNVAYIGSTSPIGGLDDLAGMRVRGAGYLSNAMASVGAEPVSMPFGELYEALQRGVIDGWITTIDGAVSVSLQETTDYWYELGTGNFTANVNPAMSLQTLNSLPQDIQDVIWEVSAELAERMMSDFMLPGMQRECEIIMSELELFEELLTEDEIDAWAADVKDGIVDDWVEAVTDAGVDDPRSIYEQHEELLAEREAQIDRVSHAELCSS